MIFQGLYLQRNAAPLSNTFFKVKPYCFYYNLA